MSGKLFLNTAAGLETYRTLKALKAEGVDSEWSFGYAVKDASVARDELPAGATRLIKALSIFEASPVLVGAGVQTRTDDLKRAELAELDEQLWWLRQQKRYLEVVRGMRDSGSLRANSADEVARAAMRSLRLAEEVLGGTN